MFRRTSAGGALMLLAVSATLAHAATAPGGTPIDMPEVTSIGATIWQYIVTYFIPIGGAGMAAVGCTSWVRQRVGNYGPMGGIGGGIGMQFVPSVIGGAQRAAPAATGWLAPLSPWLAQWQGVTGQTLVVDPVVWFVVLVIVLALALHLTRQPRRFI